MPENEQHDMLVKNEEPPKVPFKGEETKENPEEGEPSEEETLDSEQGTEEKKPEVAEEKKVTQKELDKVYARAKKAEEEAKKLKDQLAEKKPTSEVDAILEIQRATKGLADEEVEELQLRAKAKGISLSEARQDENFKIWQSGRKAKVEKEKALNPSTTQSEIDKKNPKSIEQRLKEATTLEEQEKILNELTYIDPITGRREKGLNPLKARNY